MERMRAALVEEQGRPVEVVNDVEVDDPRQDEVVVDVAHCGLCLTDVHIMGGELPFPTPVICGHEVAGAISTVGSQVEDLNIGQSVVVSCRPPCYVCYWCRRGEVHLCSRSTAWATGVLEDGGTRLHHHGRDVYRGVGIAGFAEKVVIKAAAAVPVPAGTSLQQAAVLGCAVQTGVGAVLNTARLEPGSSALVFGLGGVGASVVQGCRVAGAATVIGVDSNESRRTLAERLGATAVIDPGEGNVVPIVQEMTANVGIDYAFDTVASPRTFESSFDALRAGGRLIAIGVPGPDVRFVLPAGALVSDEKHVSGCFLGSSHPRREIERLLSLSEAGLLDLSALVTASRPLEEINDAIAEMLAGTQGLRTVIEI